MIRLLIFAILVSLMSPIQGQHNELYLIEAETALEQKDTSTAVAYLMSILQFNPQSFPAALRLSEIHYERQDLSKAALYANIALDVLHAREAKLVEADYHMKYKDTVISLNDYHQYQRLKIDIASVLHLRAKVRMQQENYFSAIVDLDSAYGYAPFNSDIQVDYGISLYKAGDVYQAMNRLYLALDIDSANYKAYYNIGIINLSQGDTTEAIRNLKKCSALNNKLSKPLIQLAGIYMDQGHYKEAIGMFTRVLEIEPKSVEALFRRGFAYNKTFDHGNAIADWEAAYKNDNSQIEAVRNAGLSRLALEDYDGAIANFTQYIDRLTGYSIGYLNRGYAFLLKKEYQKALSDFEKMVELDPTGGSGYYYTALVYAIRGNKKKACRNYSAALKFGYDRDVADELVRNLCEK